MDMIRKTPADFKVPPNLPDYAQACAEFSWETVGREFDGLPGGAGFNIAHEAVDRHVGAGHGDRVAIRWLGNEPGVRRDLTYSQLKAQSNRFANGLRALGVGAGDRGICVHRPDPGALHRGDRDAQKPQRVLPAFLRFWARTRFPAAEPGRCPGFGDHDPPV
jgi:hypothetical protein